MLFNNEDRGSNQKQILKDQIAINDKILVNSFWQNLKFNGLKTTKMEGNGGTQMNPP